MEYIEREQWVEACQMFFDAYVKFCIDGTEVHWYECNGRNIEIAFSGDSDCIMVQLYCPEVLRRLSAYFGRATERNEVLISMLHWLIWEAEEPSIYSIETADSEQEYDLLKDILTYRFSGCYYICGDWVSEGQAVFIIKLHGRQIKVHLIDTDTWSNGLRYIDIELHCLETGELLDDYIPECKKSLEKIIRKIQRMAWEN